MRSIDCVIIGVNAAKTLGHCIDSVLRSNYPQDLLHIIYVDGGSSDDSVAIARDYQKIKVIELTPEYPSPGLGRNHGWQAGHSSLVQFLDSDTVVDAHWFDKGAAAMTDTIGAVRGNRKEIHPENSVYNWLADQEWNAEPGFCDSFGGDVLVRRETLEESGGYDEDLVGGEDPELSQRLIKKGWKILQLDALMTSHDLAMTTFGQYWRRAYRTGYGFAAVFSRFTDNSFWKTEYQRILKRGGGWLFLTLLAVLCSLWQPTVALSLLLVSLLLLFTPRIFRVSSFINNKQLSVSEARRYAWHCSIVVVPELFGIFRFHLGKMAGKPLRNRAHILRTGSTVSCLSTLLIVVTLLLSSCADLPIQTEQEDTHNFTFATAPKKITDQFASAEEVKGISLDVEDDYLLGPGDVLSLNIWNRPEISNPHIVVGPDGVITVTRIGFVKVGGRTREAVSTEIVERLALLYDRPEVSLAINEYNNNKAFVLGHVVNPGVVSFPGQGTLLEALSLAGGLPVVEKQELLTKCAISRGKDKIIWVDLKELLYNGNMALNARIRNNDVIFIPENEDKLVYVIGEVNHPRVIKLKSSLTFMDALMMAGGPTKSADLQKNYVIRSDGDNGVAKEVNIEDMLVNADFKKNFLLQDNDVIYVAEKGLSKFNYNFKQLMPFLQVLELSTSVLERFGGMQEVRKKLWGQEGFVGD